MELDMEIEFANHAQSHLLEMFIFSNIHYITHSQFCFWTLEILLTISFVYSLSCIHLVVVDILHSPPL